MGKKTLVLVVVFLFISCAKQKIDTTVSSSPWERNASVDEKVSTDFGAPVSAQKEETFFSTFTQSGMVKIVPDAMFAQDSVSSLSNNVRFFPCIHGNLDVGTHLLLTDLRTDKSVHLAVVSNQKTNQEYILEIPKDAGAALGLGEEASLFAQIKMLDAESPASEELNVDYGKSANETSLKRHAIDPSLQVNSESRPFFIQVGAFEDNSKAQKVLNDLKNKGVADVRIVSARIGEKTFYRVRVGSFSNEKAAATELPTLEKDYPGSFILRD
jgi:hypothetical protein